MSFSPEDRSKDVHHHIDPGFINVRLCIETFGEDLTTQLGAKGPEPEPLASVRYDHRLVHLALTYCRDFDVPPLGVALEDLPAPQPERPLPRRVRRAMGCQECGRIAEATLPGRRHTATQTEVGLSDLVTTFTSKPVRV